MVISCTICILCKINVETLCVLSIVVVCCTKQLNRVNIMNQGVELGQIKVLTNAKLNKNGFVGMKIMEGLTKKLKGFRGVYWILSKVEEVKQSSSGLNKANRRCTTREIHIHNKPKEDPTHVSMFFASKAGKGGDSLCK